MPWPSTRTTYCPFKASDALVIDTYVENRLFCAMDLTPADVTDASAAAPRPIQRSVESAGHVPWSCRDAGCDFCVRGVLRQNPIGFTGQSQLQQIARPYADRCCRRACRMLLCRPFRASQATQLLGSATRRQAPVHSSDSRTSKSMTSQPRCSPER